MPVPDEPHYYEYENATPKSMVEGRQGYYDLCVSIKTEDKKLASDLIALMPVHPLPNLAAGDSVKLDYSLSFGLQLPEIQDALDKLRPFLEKIKERPEVLCLKTNKAGDFLRYLAKSIEAAEQYVKDSRKMFEMFYELFTAAKKAQKPRPEVKIE